MRTARKSVRWRPALRSGRPGRRYGGIYGETEFKELVLYETVRANRTHDDLSLVLCDVSHFNGDKYKAGGLIHQVVRSVRSTDHVGWHGRDEIGVLLPMTGRDGAHAFVRNLAESYGADIDSISIQAYPESWIENQRTSATADAEPSPTQGSTFARRVPVWKRALDIFGASVGLLILLPLLVLIALYIKIVSPGPVLYKSKRVGLARREFTFLKFRTMHVNNDQQVHSHHAKDFIQFDKPMTKLDGEDPRIIKGGRILRKVAVDELPQLINIIKGDMSLVGPRPCIPYEANEYQQWHAHRFSLLPGLTGLWQVSGKNKLTFQEMIRLDIAYENRMSLFFDLWIILRTFPTVAGLAFEGAKRRIGLRRAKCRGSI